MDSVQANEVIGSDSRRAGVAVVDRRLKLEALAKAAMDRGLVMHVELVPRGLAGASSRSDLAAVPLQADQADALVALAEQIPDGLILELAAGA